MFCGAAAFLGPPPADRVCHVAKLTARPLDEPKRVSFMFSGRGSVMNVADEALLPTAGRIALIRQSSALPCAVRGGVDRVHWGQVGGGEAQGRIGSVTLPPALRLDAEPVAYFPHF